MSPQNSDGQSHSYYMYTSQTTIVVWESICTKEKQSSAKINQLLKDTEHNNHCLFNDGSLIPAVSSHFYPPTFNDGSHFQ